MGHKNKKNTGFSLVELMVAVSITAVLMTGLSTFFSSTFKNMFVSGEKETNSQLQFDLSGFLFERFTKTRGLDAGSGCGTDCVVLRNPLDGKQLPFTYYGIKDSYFVYEDFFVFNGKNSTGEKSTDTHIPNPGGIVSGGMNNFFVTAPLENRIYNCPSFLNGCTTTSPVLNVPGLNQPTDIDMGPSALYVADAGNNRVIAITNPLDPTPTVTPIATDLNYPTGLAYYSPKPGEEYLFVADTYNHQVKRITLTPPYPIETVVGAGDDKVCNPTPPQPEHTALFCKLHFPTDVMIASDKKSYYIADTGNGRILQITDPAPVLTDFKLPLTLGGASTQLNRVDFELPAGSTISGAITEGPSGNDLPHPVKYSASASTISASLTALTSDIILTPCVGSPPPCSNHFVGFRVDTANNIIKGTDQLGIVGYPGTYSVDSITDEGGTFKILITPSNTTIEPPVGTAVRITNTFSGNKSFYLDLSSADFSETFNKIWIKAFDAGNTPINNPPNSVTIRIGDGVLGTSEDTVSVYSQGHDFPTGLGFQASGSFDFSTTPEYTTDFSDYDYVSSFVTDGFDFKKLNGEKVLELNFKADLGKDSEGNDQWQDYSLNSDISIP